MSNFAVTSYRLARRAVEPFTDMSSRNVPGGAIEALKRPAALPPHSSHPDFGHLVLLVFEAVLEVVCVSLPGYVLARQGMFDADAQKFVANLNVHLFTPCLIFTKLASQLTAEKLVELAVIPVIFVVQTMVSYLCSVGVSKAYRLEKRAKNFVTAMGVFGNSNSLPISLVISLSKTLSGLHWDKIPNDNDDEVAARGILYLLIFQQLGQLVRWSWGYHVLLAPPEKYEHTDEHRNSVIEEGSYHDLEDTSEDDRLIDDSTASSQAGEGASSASERISGSATPLNHQNYVLSESGDSAYSGGGDHEREDLSRTQHVLPTPTDGNLVGCGPGNLAGHGVGNGHTYANGFKKSEPAPTTWAGRLRRRIRRASKDAATFVGGYTDQAFSVLPEPVQKVLSTINKWLMKFLNGLWEFMNPPLWAMLAAIVVASVPSLQHLFFDPGTFINNSVTRAVAQSGGVAVPLILVVLGANLARNTLPREQVSTDDPQLERKLLIASLISRMLLPTLIMAPFLALMAKYVPVSILDDPIFVIVCFLLTGAPSALQLAQICQINNVYMGAMSKLLFQSYVIWILPSTLALVMMALEVVEWATQ